MHQSDVGTQEADARDPADEPRPLEVCVEESLVKRGDVSATFEVRPIESDEITILREGSGESLGTAVVPAIHHLLIEGTDRHLISR